jgi:hypothetical protein
MKTLKTLRTETCISRTLNTEAIALPYYTTLG